LKPKGRQRKISERGKKAHHTREIRKGGNRKKKTAKGKIWGLKGGEKRKKKKLGQKERDSQRVAVQSEKAKNNCRGEKTAWSGHDGKKTLRVTGDGGGSGRKGGYAEKTVAHGQIRWGGTGLEPNKRGGKKKGLNPQQTEKRGKDQVATGNKAVLREGGAKGQSKVHQTKTGGGGGGESPTQGQRGRDTAEINYLIGRGKRHKRKKKTHNNKKKR